MQVAGSLHWRVAIGRQGPARGRSAIANAIRDRPPGVGLAAPATVCKTRRFWEGGLKPGKDLKRWMGCWDRAGSQPTISPAHLLFWSYRVLAPPRKNSGRSAYAGGPPDSGRSPLEIAADKGGCPLAACAAAGQPPLGLLAWKGRKVFDLIGRAGVYLRVLCVCVRLCVRKPKWIFLLITLIWWIVAKLLHTSNIVR